MKIRFVTKGQYLTERGDSFIYFGIMFIIFGAILLFGVEGASLWGALTLTVGLVLLVGRVIYYYVSIKSTKDVCIIKIKSISSCSDEQADTIYEYLKSNGRVSDFVTAEDEKHALPPLFQSTPYELHKLFKHSEEKSNPSSRNSTFS